MSELRLMPSKESIEEGTAIDCRAPSEPERELSSFINSMASLIGPGASSSLTDLWLDELACMECIPGSDSFNWRSVSVSASVKLASRVIASQISGPFF
jgi:hypothetical protein